MALENLKVFDLTPLTRGAAEQRRAVISGIEFKWRHLVIVGVGSLVGLVFMLVFWRLLGSLAVLAVPLFAGIALWLLEGRSRRGMELRNWAHLKNKAVNNSGRFFVSGEPFDPLANTVSILSVRCLPVPTAAGGTDAPDLVADRALGDQRRRTPPAAPSPAVDAALAAWSNPPSITPSKEYPR